MFMQLFSKDALCDKTGWLDTYEHREEISLWYNYPWRFTESKKSLNVGLKV